MHVVVYGGVVAYLVLLRYPADTTLVVCIVGISSLFWGLIGACQATLQGLERTDKPAFCFQGHPEASPGPHDIGYLFDRFIGLMETAKAKVV